MKTPTEILHALKAAGCKHAKLARDNESVVVPYDEEGYVRVYDTDGNGLMVVNYMTVGRSLARDRMQRIRAMVMGNQT